MRSRAATPLAGSTGLEPALAWLRDAPGPHGRVVVLDAEDALGADAMLPPRDLVVVPTLSAASRVGEGVVTVGSADALPVAAASVGALACLAPFDALADKEAVIREWRRVTRDGAHIVAIVRPSADMDAGVAWSSYFAARGFEATADPPSASLVALRLVAKRSEAGAPAFTAPLPAEDLARLARAGASDDVDGPRPPAESVGAALPPVPPHDRTVVGAMYVLEQSHAPLFNADVGGPAARFIKRLANLPLALFGNPQRLFNVTVRALFDVCLQLIRQLRQYQSTLRDEMTLQRATIDRLTRENAALKARVEALEANAARTDGSARTP